MFLSTEFGHVVVRIRKQHRTAFTLAEELNAYANWKLLETSASKSSLQQGLVACLLPRLLSAFQGCVLMAERGMSAEATLLARKVLEVTFRIVAIAKSEDVARAYVRSHEVARRDILKKLKSLTTVRHPLETGKSIDELHAEADFKVREERLQALTTKDYAQEAGLLDYYNTAYAYFSQSAHANVRDIEDLLDKDGDGEPVSIRYGPVLDDASNILSTAIESVIFSLEPAFDLLSREHPLGLKILRRKMEALFVELDK